MTDVTTKSPQVWLARLCVGWGAFLLFALQPLAGQQLLPTFGGGPGVWTVCLLFFQAWVLAGYAAVQGLVRLNDRVQLGVWVVLLATALLSLPAVPQMMDGPPTVAVLGALLLGVGLPALVLAMASPLMQHRMGRFSAAPYGLFAWSNAGSLLALGLFPFVLEPLAARAWLISAWGWGLVGFAMLTLVLMNITRTDGDEDCSADDDGDNVETAWSWRWILFPAVAVAFMMTASRNLSQELAPGPFTWVPPLAVFLLTFVLSFGKPGWYSRGVMAVMLPIGWTAVFWLELPGITMPVGAHMVAQLLLLLLTGWMCHGELYRLRPAVVRLPFYYTNLAAGGVLGGLAVTVVAPLLFERFWEDLLVHLAAAILFVWTCHCDGNRRLARRWAMGLLLLLVGWLGLTFLHLQLHRPPMGEVLARARNFFGVVTVVQRADGERLMLHGSTVHGLEIDGEPALGYHGPGSGVSMALAALRPRGSLHVGVVGLGTGTMAAHARLGDTMRFYEINPIVTALARTHFHYLGDRPVVVGDARLELAGEAPREYDLLVMDAFNGGTVPVHLLTLEAFGGYRRHLKVDGVLAVNISNPRLDLAPVVAAAARELGWAARVVENRTEKVGERDSLWVLLTGDESMANAIGAETVVSSDAPWTDDHASLLRVWK